MSNITETRIIFVGDMHLGKAPGGLSLVTERTGLTPAAALKRVVATALDRQVHAVAFAGDLVESSNAMFEAYGPLRDAVTRLVNSNIEVVAVTGNHDTRVLPRLVSAIKSGLHVLGTEGTWSSHLIRGQAPLPLRLVGWSFPAPHCQVSPLLHHPPQPRPGEITLGLLHADLDVTKSDYAPVSSAQLLATGYQGWFLGHIHSPGTPAPDLAPFYLGSLTPLDPSETGIHGPVLVTVHQDSSLTAERLPLAPLQWEHLDITCPPMDQPREDIPTLLLEHMLATLDTMPAREIPLPALGFRIHLAGRLPEPGAIHAAAAAIPLENLSTVQDGTSLFVEKLTCEVTAAHDLEKMAAHGDPVGLLARRILAWESQGDAAPDPTDPLLAAAINLQKTLGHRSHYTALSSPGQEQDFAPRTLRQLLLRVAYRLLDVMVEERGSNGVSV